MRCFANSMILLSNFIDFGQQIHWFWSANSLILLYHHVEICAQKNCFTSQTKVVLLIKTIWFAIASATYLHETFVSQSIIPTSSSRSTIVYKQGNPQYFSTGPYPWLYCSRVGLDGYINKKRVPKFWNSLWALRDSNPRPSACKADALNQLS